jgi:hypothetical protein
VSGSGSTPDNHFGEEISPRHSGLRIEVKVSVGYTRQRAGLEVSDKWEGAITSLLLLVLGAAIVIWFIVTVVSRIVNIQV